MNFELEDGDKVIFNDDLHAQVIDVQVSGSYLGPSYFAVNKRTHLHELLSYIPVDPQLANFKSVYILRKKCRQETKKEMIEESLNRLERSVFLQLLLLRMVKLSYAPKKPKWLCSLPRELVE
ncbi:hypothetical protein QW180_08570 [Vibrio sinaloensis]|nr:hypothetical protein [Vibrio sinaloensis]